MTLLEIVKDNVAEFSHYRAGIAYYTINVADTLYSFPLPVEDLQQASIFRTHKAIQLMRYIRKALNDQTFVKAG